MCRMQCDTLVINEYFKQKERLTSRINYKFAFIFVHSGTILPTTNAAAANVSAPPPPYYSYAPPAMSGPGSSGPQQPTGSSYNFSYAAGTPPVGSSEYTYNAAVQDGRDSCYNMVYFPPNPTTGFNGHFSLVTPPQQHQETPIDGAVVNPAVTSSGQTMQDSWHPSSWASQAQATSNCNLMENNQHYSISTGFASQSDAEMALSTTGKCAIEIFY